MAKKATPKQSPRLKALITAGEELNEVLGIEPAIDLTLGEEELEAKLLEASELITTEDEFTKATEVVLQSLAPEEDADYEEEEDDEEEEADDEEADDEEEDNDEEEASDATAEIQSLIDTVKTTKKRKDLKDMVEGEAVFEPLRSKMKRLSSAQALHNAMLKHLRGILEDGSAPAAPAKAAPAKPATTKKTKPASNLPTKKSVVLEMAFGKGKAASVEEIAQKIVDMGIDDDLKKNKTVVRQWIYKIKKANEAKK